MRLQNRIESEEAKRCSIKASKLISDDLDAVNFKRHKTLKNSAITPQAASSSVACLSSKNKAVSQGFSLNSNAEDV